MNNQVHRAREAERQRHNKHDEKRHEPKAKDESSTSTGNNKESSACKLHDGAHLWKDCPDNKWNKNKKEQRKAEAAEKKAGNGDMHSTSASVAGKKKSPMVKIADNSGDLDYTTDEEED